MTIQRSAKAVEIEHRLATVYQMRDSLMREHGYDERQATEVATLCVETLAALSDDELIDVKRAVNLMKRLRRDARIKEDLRTGNAAQVAQREGLSVASVYRIAGQRG